MIASWKLPYIWYNHETRYTEMSDIEPYNGKFDGIFIKFDDLGDIITPENSDSDDSYTNESEAENENEDNFEGEPLEPRTLFLQTKSIQTPKP